MALAIDLDYFALIAVVGEQGLRILQVHFQASAYDLRFVVLALVER
jgi:hypothetical protein